MTTDLVELAVKNLYSTFYINQYYNLATDAVYAYA